MSDVDHIAIAQREATAAQRRSVGQVAREQKRSQRSAKRGSGGGLRTAKGRRAPRSASQFHFTKKYSNQAGKNRAPSSALKKLAYDFRLTLTDSQGRAVPPGANADDLDYAYISAHADTPKDALDLAKLAQEAQRSAGRQSNSRQMAHYDISLPNDLSKEARNALVRKLADDTRSRMDGVPVFAAVHAPDSDNGNWHVHISHPLRKIEAVGDDAFKLTNRIMHEQRPAVRRAAGLPATNHSELKAHRDATARLISDALLSEGHDPQLAARWRYGHLTLERQVEQAVQRGDVQFVIDNHSRPATRHVGPSGHHGKLKNATTEHNDSTNDGIDAAVLTRAMINSVLNTAHRLNIQSPKHLQLLALDMGLQLHWSTDRKTGSAQGVQWQTVGGPRLPGADAGCSLGQLKRRMSWSETPTYQRKVARTGEVFESYKDLLEQKGKGNLAGRGVSILDRVINAQIQKKEDAIAAAEAVHDVETHEQPRQRPKRANSKEQSKDSLNSRKPQAAKEPPTMDASTIKQLMADLSRLPDEPDAQHQVGGSIVTHAPSNPFKPQPPTQLDIDALTEPERQYLRDQYDYLSSGGDFRSPAADAKNRVDRLYLALDKINKQEPLEHDERTVTVKRLFRKPVVQDSPALVEWREKQEKAQKAYEQGYAGAARNFAKIYADPELFALLPAFRVEQSNLASERDRLDAEKHDNLIERNREQMTREAYRADERQDDADHRRTRNRGG